MQNVKLLQVHKLLITKPPQFDKYKKSLHIGPIVVSIFSSALH